ADAPVAEEAVCVYLAERGAGDGVFRIAAGARRGAWDADRALRRSRLAPKSQVYYTSQREASFRLGPSKSRGDAPQTWGGLHRGGELLRRRARHVLPGCDAIRAIRPLGELGPATRPRHHPRRARGRAHSHHQRTQGDQPRTETL